jgi:hypothetical protein
MTHMKSKLVFTLLLVTIFLFPGCYTVLLVDDTYTTTTSEPVSSPESSIDYVPVYIPEPIFISEPPIYLPPAGYVPTSPVTTTPSSDDRRLTHTGRGPADSNPEPANSSENDSGIRDSGVRRSGR